jgi:hypothetical protein
MLKIVTTTAMVLMLATSAIAQDLSSSIVGVWKIVGRIDKVTATGETFKPFGDKPDGFILFTKGGHFAAMWTAEGRKPAATVPPTEAERAAAYTTSFATAGTYKIEGDTLITHYAASANQGWVGTDRKSTIKIDGKVLHWTSAPFKTLGKGEDATTQLTFERVE